MTNQDNQNLSIDFKNNHSPLEKRDHVILEGC